MQTKKNEEKTNKVKKFLKIIVENLILEVKDCHIRIEDCGVTIPSSSYAFGFQLESISLEPTDDKFEREFVNPEIRKKEGISHSLIKIKGISLYADLLTKGNFCRILTDKLDFWSQRPDIAKMPPEEYFKLSFSSYYQNNEKVYFVSF